MTNILDHFLQRITEFHPKTMDELFTLRLAQKLSEPSAAADYAALLAEHPLERLLTAYRCAVKAGNELAMKDQFYRHLRAGHGRLTYPEAVRLMAIKVERRSVAAAVYDRRQIEYTQVRHLASSSGRAQASAVGFINWICSNYDIQSATMETAFDDNNVRRTVLTKTLLEDCILGRNVSFWPVSKQELLQGFGYPALETRKELREVILSIWPALQDERASEQQLDAVALGALVQTDRLFII